MTISQDIKLRSEERVKLHKTVLDPAKRSKMSQAEREKLVRGSNFWVVLAACIEEAVLASGVKQAVLALWVEKAALDVRGAYSACLL